MLRAKLSPNERTCPLIPSNADLTFPPVVANRDETACKDCEVASPNDEIHFDDCLKSLLIEAMLFLIFTSNGKKLLALFLKPFADEATLETSPPKPPFTTSMPLLTANQVPLLKNAFAPTTAPIPAMAAPTFLTPSLVPDSILLTSAATPDRPEDA